MLVVRGKTAINLDALTHFRYSDTDFDQKLIFGDAQLKTANAAQIFKEIIEAYERGAKVYRIRE